MNKNQKRVIIIGIVLVILSWLFPFYEGEFRGRSPMLKKNIGPHFIFFPPSSKAISKKLLGKDTEDQGYLMYYHSRIVTSYLYAQLVVILLACAGLYLLFSDKKKPDREKNEGVSFYKK